MLSSPKPYTCDFDLSAKNPGPTHMSSEKLPSAKTLHHADQTNKSNICEKLVEYTTSGLTTNIICLLWVEQHTLTLKTKKGLKFEILSVVLYI